MPSNNPPMSIKTDDATEALRVDPLGNVGIGTTTPARKLHVENTEIHSGGSVAGFSFGNRESPAFVDVPGSGERWVWYSSQGTARLWSATDKLTITSTGNVGIGTTTPSARLSVTGSMAVNDANNKQTITIEGTSGDITANGIITVPQIRAGSPEHPFSISKGAISVEVPQGSALYAKIWRSSVSVELCSRTGREGFAGDFHGNVRIVGSLDVSGPITKHGGGFKIDHPLDPANKSLSHSFVESAEMKNFYDGVAVLDAQGEAVVELPAWFEVLNKEIRYQLTCIGGYAPVYIAEKVHDHRFKIAGGTPGMEVCWLVTGIRQDAWANAHRIQVEEDKPAEEQGTYLYPEVYGEPPEKHVQRVRFPEMKRPAVSQGFQAKEGS